MKQFSFIAQTVKIADTQIHPILSSFGFSYGTNKQVQNGFNYFNKYYDRPVVIETSGIYKIITQSLDYNTVLASGLEEIDVYVCDLVDEIDIRIFITTRHYKHEKNWAASYSTYKFFETYFKTPEGKVFYRTIEGESTRSKIAMLIGTSDKTMERITYVGKNELEGDNFLQLISAGSKTYTEVYDEIARRKDKEKAAEQAVAEKKKEQSGNNVVPFSPQHNLNSEEDVEEEPTDDLGNDTEVSEEDQPDFGNTLPFNEELKSITIEFENGVPYVTINGRKFNSMKLMAENILDGQLTKLTLKDGLTNGMFINVIIGNYISSYQANYSHLWSTENKIAA